MDESNSSTSSFHQQAFVQPPADTYPQTKTILDMYTKTLRTITITSPTMASDGRIPEGVPGAADLFHE